MINKKHLLSPLLAIAALACIHEYSFGQASSGIPSTQQAHLNIIPPSPEAASLGKFGDIPVGYYTGAANLSIPLTTLKSGSITFPVSLDYNSAGGTKVGEVANSAGLGWSLSASNVVTRTVMGAADDQNGFLWTVKRHGPEFLEKMTNYTEGQAVSQIQALVRVAEGCYDFQPDIFNYNFAGYSGKFYFNWNGDLVNMSSTPLQFSYTWDVAPSGDTVRIGSWAVVTPDGTKYTFGAPERTDHKIIPEINYLGYIPPCSYMTSFTSSWYLTKIEDPDGNSINLGYDGYNYRLSSYASQQVKVVTDNTIKINSYTSGCTPQYYSPPQLGIVNNSAMCSKSYNTYFMNRIKTITASSGLSLTFNYLTDRNDDDGFLGHGGYFKSLDSIVLKYGSSPLKRWGLVHDYSTGRLTLRQLVEQDNNAQTIDKYLFDYQGTIPTSIMSFAIDDWGYYNYAYNNTTSVPTFIDSFYYSGTGGNGMPTILLREIKFKGGNREVNPDGSVAGLLKKITYPTKGTTEINYEHHDCSRIGEQPVSKYKFHPKHQAYAAADAIANANQQLVKNTTAFSVTEGCIVNVIWSAYINNLTSASPLKKPKMFINKIDGNNTTTIVEKQFTYTFDTTYVGNVYFEEMYLLPPGQYELVAEAQLYDLNHNRPDEAHVQLSYEKADTSVILKKIPIGGARVKSIINRDNNNTMVNEKDFYYNDPDTPLLSSGVIESLPIHSFSSNNYRTLDCGGTFYTGGSEGTAAKFHIANNTNILSGTKGSHIGYQYVTIKENGLGKKVMHYTSFAQYPSFVDDVFPFMPPLSFSYRTGLLKDEKDYRLNGSQYQLVHAIANQYSFTDSDMMVPAVFFFGSGDQVLEHGNKIDLYYTSSYDTYFNKLFQFDNYILKTGYSRLTQQTETFYSPDPISTVTNNTYHPTVPQLIQSNQTTNSDGIDSKTAYTYPPDMAASSVRTAMLNKNMIGLPVSTKTYNNGTLTSTVQNNYGLFNGDQVELQNKQSSTYNSALQTEVTFNKYDAKGNLLCYTTRQGISTVILWGYNSTYPVAQVEHVDTAALTTYLNANPSIQTTCNDPASDQALRNVIQQLRNQFPNALITGMTYRPPLGMTSKTDPNNMVTYFDYDSFGRLADIKDKDGKVLKKYTYHYRPQ